MNFETKTYTRNEIVLKSTKEYKNPFLDVEINAIFTDENNNEIKIPGFWNGKDEYKVRYAFEDSGLYKYKITCTDSENIGLFDEGTINISEKENKNYLEQHGYVKLTGGKRYFEHKDKTPFFYIGDTHWQMPDYERMNECNYPGCSCGNQFLHLLKDRVKKGFNVYQTYFASSNNKWWKEKYTIINPEAFNESMDIMIEELTDKGMTIPIGFGCHQSTIEAYGDQRNGLLAFARYCVARYACYPVMWITAQEITISNRPDLFEGWLKVGEVVGKCDGYKRPNSTHMNPMPATDERIIKIDNEPWHQCWTLQGGHGSYQRLKSRSFYESYRKNEKVKPYIESEAMYEDIYCEGFNGSEAPRIAAWQAILCGCCGYTYGVSGVWALGWDQKNDPGWPTFSPDSWYIGMEKVGSTQITYLKEFFEYVGWYNLEPSFNNEFGEFDMRKYVSISHKDRDIIIYYFFSEYEERGILKGLKKNTKYQARFFDPINNAFIDLPDIITENGEVNIPKLPSIRDWVLLLNTYDLGEYKTEEFPKLFPLLDGVDMDFSKSIKIKVSASTEDEEHPVSNINDGTSSYWCGYSKRTQQTLILEAEKEVELTDICFELEKKFEGIIQYRFYGSMDGLEYFPILERMERGNRITEYEPKIYRENVSGKVKFVKMFFASTDYGDNLMINNIWIFGK